VAPIGCRHVAAAANPAHAPAYFSPSYHAAADDVRAAVAAVVRRLKDGARVHNDTLRGESSAQGVLVVTGTTRTVNPSSAQSSYFVYDRTRDDAFVADTLVPRLAIDGLTADDLIAASRRQLAASLGAVASGKPVFAIDADGVEPVVTHAGRVAAPAPSYTEPGIESAKAGKPPGRNRDAEP